MSSNIDPNEQNNPIISFLSGILTKLENLNFVYRTSGSETDANSNSVVISNAITVSGTAIRDVDTLTNIDGYSQQQTARQASILQWCSSVRKKVT